MYKYIMRNDEEGDYNYRASRMDKNVPTMSQPFTEALSAWIDLGPIDVIYSSQLSG